MTIATVSSQVNSEQNQLSPMEKNWELMPEPDISNIEIEDNQPVDNLISEKQQRLLTVAVYSSFQTELSFLITANVGLFYAANKPPLVPDVMLSLKVKCPQDWTEKKNRSYFTWNFGKSPEVAIEIVSNKVGHELDSKLEDYINAGVSYYVVFDPLKYLSNNILQVYQRRGNHYHLQNNYWLEEINLGLTLWVGEFEQVSYETWLRWCDQSGNILLTGDEKAIIEKERADKEKERAEHLAKLLREQGIDPDKI